MHRYISYSIYLILAAITITVFFEVQEFSFVNFDDPVYISDNPNVKFGLTNKSIYWAFSSIQGGFWFPITWISHMIDCDLYGLNPSGHHLSNLFLHTLNVLFLFSVLKKMTGSQVKSAFVAILFAVHPLHVEPVAWVSCRKDILCALFWILTMRTYLWYTDNPRLLTYSSLLITFCLGLMAKPMIVTLPFVLLLLDYWPLNRLNPKNYFVHKKFTIWKQSSNYPKIRIFVLLILEKLPLIILSLTSSVLVYLTEENYGAIKSLESFPFGVRFANALVAYLLYIFKLICPINLTFFYPHAGMPLWWEYVGSGIILICASFLITKYGKNYPYLRIGWLWYLITLLPVIGLVQIGNHSLADRYTYIPLIGIFILIVWGIEDTFNKNNAQKKLLIFIGGLAIIFCIIGTSSQLKFWRNSTVLFKHAVEINPNNYMAHNNLAIELLRKGNLEEAFIHFSAVVKAKPLSLESHNNMGVILARLGKYEEAIASFHKVLQLAPDSLGANFNLGRAFAQQGKLDKASSCFRRIIAINPSSAHAYYNLGLILNKNGKFQEAIFHFSKALHFKPNFPDARHNMESVLEKITAPKHLKKR